MNIFKYIRDLTSEVADKLSEILDGNGKKKDLKGLLFYHGSRIIFLLSIAIFIRFMFPVTAGTEYTELEEGSVASERIVAPFDFEVRKTKEELESERKQVTAAVRPILSYFPATKDSVVFQVESFFTDVDSLSTLVESKRQREKKAILSHIESIVYVDSDSLIEQPYPDVTKMVRVVKDNVPSLTTEGLLYLLSNGRKKVERRSIEFISKTLDKGYLTDETLANLREDQFTLLKGVQEIPTSRRDLVTQSSVLDAARNQIVDANSYDVSRQIFLTVITRFIKPNIVYNAAMTDNLKELARGQISGIKAQVLKGELIVDANHRVTKFDLEKLRSLKENILKREAEGGDFGTFRPDVGTILINLIILLIFGLYLYLYRNEVYGRFSFVFLIGLVVMMVMIPAGFIFRYPEISLYLIPMPLAAVLLVALFDGRLAMLCVLVLALLLGGQSGFGFSTMFVSLMGGLVAALSVRRLRRRRQLYRSMLYIVAAYVGAILIVDLLKIKSAIETLESCGWGALNGIVSTILAIGILPIFEWLFSITTDSSLLELSDLNHPLLRRLAIEAPGTYHHSIIAGTLAESAADGIEANGLMARVGAYYHDIGKLKKPDYFIENQKRSQKNPHDKLTPSMSALILKNHVKEGAEMAEEAGLPPLIRDFIREHLGTTMITSFYAKAKELEPDAAINVHDFSYPGPKPTTRESAIVMLSDSIEAASRVLADPTPSRIEGLVNTIINKKFSEGQLDSCDLTLKDLRIIGEKFTKVLLGVFHSRIDYPAIESKPKRAEVLNVKKDKAILQHAGANLKRVG